MSKPCFCTSSIYVWAAVAERVEGVRKRERESESCTAVRPGLGSGQDAAVFQIALNSQRLCGINE